MQDFTVKIIYQTRLEFENDYIVVYLKQLCNGIIQIIKTKNIKNDPFYSHKYTKSQNKNTECRSGFAANLKLT